MLNFNGLPVQNAQFCRLFCVLIRLLSCWALQEAILKTLYYKALRGSLKKLAVTIYSVRTQDQIKARIALDMWREAQGERREQTLQALHEARAG